MVTIKYFNADESQETKRLDYHVHFEFLKRIDHKHYLFSIEKSDVFINRREPTYVIEQIADTIAKTIYPLNLILNNRGKCIEITNLDTIKTRWRTTRKRMEREYKGEMVTRLFEQIEKITDNPVKFEIALSRELFWNIFFHGAHMNYDNTHEQQQKMLFSLDPYHPPYVFDGIGKIHPNITDYNTIQKTYRGHSGIPDFSLFNRNKEKNTLWADLAIDYDLDMETNLPVSVEAVCSVKEKESKDTIKVIDLYISRLEKPDPDNAFL